MSSRQRQMVQAFAEHEQRLHKLSADHLVVGVPVGTRLQRIIRLPNGWRLWVATSDFRYGTYLELDNNGAIVSVTTRKDEGDDFIRVRPSDDEITHLHM